MSLSDDFNIHALKDTHDYSCFLARLDEHLHSITYTRPGLGVLLLHRADARHQAWQQLAGRRGLDR
jgi:hypothetical protein